MKKMLALLVVLTLVPFTALAADMGVVFIGGPEMETEPVSLDDIQLNEEVDVPGYGVITVTSFTFTDGLGYYGQGYNYVGNTEAYYWSGKEAEFAVLYMDILNTATSGKDFLANCEVKAVYDDIYEYGGWSYQRNYNNASYGDASLDADKNKQNVNWVINPADQFTIDPMYLGHYVFGAALPNAVVNSDKPLMLIITIDGNEITYNIRK